MDRSMSSKDAVAVLGTGIMGAPMARNLLAVGAASAREAAAGASIVLTMLTDADAVLETAADALAGADVWVQTSTVGVEGAERCAALAAERGVALVDAPVLGSRQPAEDGSLTVLAS